jgi:hypothetical protein
LIWSTGKEVSFRGFDIERSEDGVNWNKLAFIQSSSNGSATNEYSFYDYNAFPGVSFYRLKLLSADGSYKYGPVRSITLQAPNTNFRITPNPVQEHAALHFTLERNETVIIYVTDPGGKRILSKQASARTGTNQVKLDNLSHLLPGVYIVQVMTGSKTLNTKMIVQ